MVCIRITITDSTGVDSSRERRNRETRKERSEEEKAAVRVKINNDEFGCLPLFWVAERKGKQASLLVRTRETRGSVGCIIVAGRLYK